MLLSVVGTFFPGRVFGYTYETFILLTVSLAMYLVITTYETFILLTVSLHKPSSTFVGSIELSLIQRAINVPKQKTCTSYRLSYSGYECLLGGRWGGIQNLKQLNKSWNTRG